MLDSIKAWMFVPISLIWLPVTTAYAGDDHGYTCDVEPAVAFPFFEPDVEGRGRLCVRPGGLSSHIRLTNLMPGNVYTVWWTYQDDPTLCTGDSTGTGGASLTGGVSPCEIADFGPQADGSPPLGIFGRMASGVAPASGRLTLRGSAGGMLPSSGSEVWFWVLTHGTMAADGAALARQLLTPEDPAAGAPHLGNEADGQQGFPVATVVFKIDQQ